jgi:hypothetical protein
MNLHPMQIENQNLDMRCFNFESIQKLNQQLLEIAATNKKAPEILLLCKSNLESIQIALGDLDSRLKDIPSNSEIKQDVSELNQALHIFAEKIQQLNEMADRSLHFEQKSAKKRQGMN